MTLFGGAVSFYRVLDVIGFFRAECWRFGDLRAKFGNEKGYQLTQFTKLSS